jgi:hypothetical protein
VYNFKLLFPKTYQDLIDFYKNIKIWTYKKT